MHTPEQINNFNARIKRIEDPRFTHVVDPESGMKIPRRVMRNEIGQRAPGSATSLIMAFVLGALCLMVARYLRMEVINIHPYFPDGIFIELAMASLAAFVIGGFVKMRSVRTAVSQLSGAAVCAVTMHNAVWFAPDQFAFVFSQGYVDQILAQTDPLSIHVSGLSLALKV